MVKKYIFLPTLFPEKKKKMDFVCFTTFFKKQASKKTSTRKNFKLHGFLYLKAKGLLGHPNCKHIYTVTRIVYTAQQNFCYNCNINGICISPEKY